MVAYDIPGVDQLVDTMATGVLVTHGDKEALAEACQRVLADPTLAARLADAAEAGSTSLLGAPDGDRV